MKRLNESEYKNALARIEALLIIIDDNTTEDDKNLQELVKLSDLVKEYEEEHYPVGIPTLKEVIELRMFEMKLKQKDLAKLLNTSTSRISEYLNGKRDITMNIARALHKKFDIDAEVILQ